MPSNSFESGLQQPVRSAVSDCGMDNGFGNDWPLASGASFLPLAVGFFPQPTLQYFGFHDWLVNGTWTQSGADDGELWAQLYVDGAGTSTVFKFANIPVPLTGPAYFRIEARMAVLGSVEAPGSIDENAQELTFRFRLWDASSVPVMLVDETQATHYALDTTVDHTIGFQLALVSHVATYSAEVFSANCLVFNERGT